jgi:hypothetical protein
VRECSLALGAAVVERRVGQRTANARVEDENGVVERHVLVCAGVAADMHCLVHGA